MSAIRTAEQSALAVQQKLEEKRREELEKQKTAVADQIKQVEKLRGQIEKMVGALSAKIQLSIDTATAEQQLAKLREDAAKDVKTNVKADTTAASEELDKWRAEQESKVVKQKIVTEGGSTPGYAHGGKIGGTGSTDSRIVAVTPGEWIINPQAVRHYGDNLFAALNALALPVHQFRAIGRNIRAQIGGIRFAEGGKVGTDSLAVQLAAAIQGGLDNIAAGLTSAIGVSLARLQATGAGGSGSRGGIPDQTLDRLGAVVDRLVHGLEAGSIIEIRTHSDGSATITGGGKQRLY